MGISIGGGGSGSTSKSDLKFKEITVSGGTATFDFANEVEANRFTNHDGDVTLSIDNMPEGASGLWEYKNTDSSSHTITFPSNTEVIDGGGSGKNTLDVPANTLVVISLYNRGSNYRVNYEFD